MKKPFLLALPSISLVALAAFFAFPAVSNAQVGISLYPIKFDVTIQPGQSYSDSINVINPNDFPIGVQPQIENIQGGNQGTIQLENTDIPHGLASWITMSTSTFTLGPKEQKEVPFTIAVPADGQPGGNYGAILFEGLPGASSTGVGISGRVGSVILVNVPGVNDATGDISDFTGPGAYVSHGPLNFSFTVQDTGNTYFTPTGTVTLSGWFFGSQQLPFNSGVVFPGYDRVYTASWGGRYAFGPMTATVSITIPDSGTVTKTVTFFMFPWQEGLIGLAILIVLYFLIRIFGKNFKLVRVKK